MTAIEIAPSFIEAARAVEGDDPQGIEFSIDDATNVAFPDNHFEFAVTLMLFLDMPNQAKAPSEAHRVLVNGGFLQFSIIHPCFVLPKRKTLRDARGEVYTVEVAELIPANKRGRGNLEFRSRPC